MIFSCVESFFVYAIKIPDLSLPPCTNTAYLQIFITYVIKKYFDTNLLREDR
jgi:hypothetical protein